MNQAELIKAVMDKCRPGDFASKAAAERAVNALTSVIGDELKAGNDVSIYGRFVLITFFCYIECLLKSIGKGYRKGLRCVCS